MDSLPSSSFACSSFFGAVGASAKPDERDYVSLEPALCVSGPIHPLRLFIQHTQIS
jgi:hypothetical protein